MTADPSAAPRDELATRSRLLAAERLRPEPPPPDYMRELIALLDQLLTYPGPPDRARSALPPGPPDRQESRTLPSTGVHAGVDGPVSAVHRTDQTQDRNDKESPRG